MYCSMYRSLIHAVHVQIAFLLSVAVCSVSVMSKELYMLNGSQHLSAVLFAQCCAENSSLCVLYVSRTGIGPHDWGKSHL